jgi:hypothetical protein
MATLVELQRQLELAQIELQRLNTQATALSAQYAAAGYPTGGALYDSIVANSVARKEVATQIDSLIIQISQINSSGTSAGNIVQNDDAATVPNASTQRPQSPPEYLDNGRIRPPPDTSSGTNAQVSPTPDAQDYGTDDELRPTIITQGTPGTSQAGVATNPAADDGRTPVPGGEPGAGAGGDDSGTTTVSSTQREVDILFNEEKIIPQSNVLDQYASYTYTASIYLMTVEAVGNMMRTKKKSLDGSLLLMQSGGAPVGARNQFFTNDYYIDSIRLTSNIQGKGTNAAHNVTNMDFTIVEPNGISLIDNLDLAITQYLGNDNKKKNWGAANYLLVIRFYGYDVDGNLVRGGVPKLDGSTDESAFVEKFYPFQIRDLRFQVSNKVVEYRITAVGHQYITSVGTNRGTIPYNLELGGKSVKDILTGPASFISNAFSNPYTQNLDQQAQDLIAAAGGTVPAPQNLSSAPSNSQSIRQGLFTALNQFQQNLVPRIYEIADEYEIEFVGDAIANAKIAKGGAESLDTGYSCSPIPRTPDQSLLGNLSLDPTSRIDGIVAGTQIVQAIEAIVRNSTYIQDQQLYKYNEKTRKWQPANNGARNLAWYKISFEVYPLGWDSKRNDYAYKMKYIVSPYRINDAPPPYFPQPQFKGTHKIYEYWFTGNNTQVLEYVQDFNTQYTQVLSGSYANFLAKETQSVNTLQKYNFSPNSNESNQQADTYVNEPAANLADYLYNPGDLNRVNLTIVGDPAWLQQGEAFAGQRPDNWNFSAFQPDGTINFDSQQVLFEVLFNKPVDYDLNTGLIDPGKNNFGSNRAANNAGRARQSYIFAARTVENMFERGKFTQKLSGVARRYATPTAASSAYQTTSLDQQALELQQAFGQQRFGTGATPFVPGTTVANPLYAPVLNKVSSAIGQAVRGIAARPYPQPQAPSSSGQPVGSVNTPGIDPTTGQPYSSNERVIDPTTGQPYSANERVVGQGATPDNNTQVGAADDDAGYGYDPYSQQNQDDLNLQFGSTEGP